MSDLLLQILKILISSIVEFSQAIRLDDKWARARIDIIVPFQARVTILKVSVNWEVDEAICDGILFQRLADLFGIPDLELWHSNSFIKVFELLVRECWLLVLTSIFSPSCKNSMKLRVTTLQRPVNISALHFKEVFLRGKQFEIFALIVSSHHRLDVFMIVILAKQKTLSHSLRC